MLIICQNDYPLYVCPTTTTHAEATVFAKVVQNEMNHDRERDARQRSIFIHVQTAEMLTEKDIKEKIQ